MLTTTQINELRPAIERTWMHICDDAYDVCEGDNEIAMEMVLDANRMMYAGFPEEDQRMRTLCLEHGFGAVRQQLANAIQLL